ncbi:MAG: hypothetical protein HC904_09975 [Blastochloris sp.]|nr:hypothetical protein [Blastochloris sp.]
MLRTFWVLLLCLGLPACLSAEDQALREMIDRAVKVDRELREKRTAYEYDLEMLMEKLDRKDSVLSTRELKATVRPSVDISYSIEIEQDTERKSEAERKKEQSEMAEAQKIMTKVELEKLVERFEYRMEGREMVLGRSAQIIAFQPKKGVPVASREEKVINALKGRLWIDRSSYAILRSEAQLSEPTAVAWFFATMREMTFAYEASFLPNGDPAPARFDLFYDVQVPFGYQRQRQKSVMKNYRLVQAER